MEILGSRTERDANCRKQCAKWKSHRRSGNTRFCLGCFRKMFSGASGERYKRWLTPVVGLRELYDNGMKRSSLYE